MAPLKISIATPTLNRLDFLRRCTRSVLGQDYEHVEHVVVDGASADGTVEFLQSLSAQHGDRVRWVSRPDKGISQAVNTAFGMATGDVVGWIGSDDCLTEGALRTASRYFEEYPQAQWLYGSFIIVDGEGRTIRLKRAREFNYRRLVRTGYICPPSVFVRQELIRRVGPLREDFRYAMDFDWCLRMAALATPHKVDDVLASFGWHRGSVTNACRLAQLDEGRRISQAFARNNWERAWIAAAYKFYKIRAWSRRRLLRVFQNS
jgi:glycosyltransferase involved in cell wall biosynthesis